MTVVITYGTYDFLHYGHLRLLEKAKALGDYLIVGVTADDFDKKRGKINVQQTLEERIEGVRKTGLADKIIIEEYDGQKIDDIKRYGVDVFTVGSDWEGQFDYLNEYCKVIYLPRTDGISSSEIRSQKAHLRIGVTGHSLYLKKFINESQYVNTIETVGICVPRKGVLEELKDQVELYTCDYDELLENVDAVYILSHPKEHYCDCKKAIKKGVHVLCESPVAMNKEECDELDRLAINHHVVLMEAISTAYVTAYMRMLLLLKMGKIGDVVSVDATCTSLSTDESIFVDQKWGALATWGPTALLPVFQILGIEYKTKNVFAIKDFNHLRGDVFTKIDFTYPNATATIKVGTGVKSEGEMIISGTKGYVYVPAPWWKTDYFEIRYENPADNQRYFYQIDGAGIRYELVAFADAVKNGKPDYYISRDITRKIASVMESSQTE